MFNQRKIGENRRPRSEKKKAPYLFLGLSLIASSAFAGPKDRYPTPPVELDAAKLLPSPPAPPVRVPTQTTSRLFQLQESAPVFSQESGFHRFLRVPAAPAVATQTLIVYDTTGAWGFLGELYAQQAANLVSHFGTWKAVPTTSYTAGMMNAYKAVIYVGSTYDEPIPAAFLADVRAGGRPVIWMYDNIWQLTPEYADFAGTTGWNWTGFDTSSLSGVEYKGTVLERDSANTGGIMGLNVVDPAKGKVLATAIKADGSKLPWAVQSGNLIYVSEIPFSYAGMNDRYLAFSDLLYSVLAPTTPTRHRALVRIEDVGPDADPIELRAVADVLKARNVPFSVAVYPVYMDPKGVDHNGVATSFVLAQKPQVVSALRYMQSKGGTLIMHGTTHQFSNLVNPYTGASGDDFEFYTAHVDSTNTVVYDGPVSGDSQAKATSRILTGELTFLGAGLAIPQTFEPPHYAASAADYKAISTLFKKRYDRGLYFGGLLKGGAVDYTHLNGQFFPFLVKDIYGTTVIPENIGNVEPLPYNNHPARLPADLLATAQKNLVIRDGFASFFYHPYNGTAMLVQVVDGLKTQGWTFVTADSVTN